MGFIARKTPDTRKNMKSFVSRTTARILASRINRVKSTTQPCLTAPSQPREAHPIRVHSCSFVTSAARSVLRISTQMDTDKHGSTQMAIATNERRASAFRYSITPLLLCLLAALTPAHSQAEELIPEPGEALRFPRHLPHRHDSPGERLGEPRTSPSRSPRSRKLNSGKAPTR